MTLQDIRSIHIPEGEVVRILAGDTVLWQQQQAAYRNLLPLATDADRQTVYNGCGFMTGRRLSSSGSVATSGAEMCVTGFIPAKAGDVLRVQGFAPVSGVNYYVIAYNAAGTKTGYRNISGLPECATGGWVSPGYFELTLDAATYGAGFDAVRITVRSLTADSIVTVNQPIV